MNMRISVPARGAALVALAAALLSLGGCASAGGGSEDARGATTSRSARAPITREEIGDRSGLDLYELVRQLRPSWLQSRGQATPTGGVRLVQVVVDGTRQPGGVEVLRTLRGSQVQELRHLTGQEATTRYGLDVEGGVIVVTTDRGRGGAA
ncbi:MAG: hypothetical protein AMXMBFR53_20490 [Gemmatimonadota bacterium]